MKATALLPPQIAKERSMYMIVHDGIRQSKYYILGQWITNCIFCRKILFDISYVPIYIIDAAFKRR